MADRRPASTPTAETPGVVIGNHENKYASTNPAIRWLTRRFLVELDAILDEVAAAIPDAAVLEVGCGEGEIAARLHHRFGQVAAVDLPDAGLRSQWASIPGPAFLHADAHRLPFPADTFDLVVGCEVLEHLPEPARGLAEMARVARGHLVLSVPREPIFRMGNLCTGRHVTSLGNTPGHLNHWSTRSFVRFVSTHAHIRRVATPLPWTMTWAQVR